MTPALIERVGKAATLWAGGGEVFVGRDTRASGPELEAALARGIASAGGTAVLGGVLPTPAVALQVRDLGAVVSASHNPPQYNGVKLFDRAGRKLSDGSEEQMESLLDAPASGGGRLERVADAAEHYVGHVLEHFGGDLDGLKVGVDCANGAYAAIAPGVFRRLGAAVTPVATEPDGTNINVGCGATDLSALQQIVTTQALALGDAVDGDQILAVLALQLGVDLVAVTSMTNLAFHRLMDEHGIRVVTTDVGDRYILEALYREGGVLGAEQSGHIVYLRDHVTGDGLVAALLLCRALEGRSLADAVAVLERYPQATENVAVRTKAIPDGIHEEAERLRAALDGRGRVLVRPSGTEPVIRVLAEAQTAKEAADLCGRIAALVRRELG